jgi:hypothetical protein
MKRKAAPDEALHSPAIAASAAFRDCSALMTTGKL